MWLCKSIEKNKRRRNVGVKDGEVSQQLKQWVHRCPPPILKKEKGKIRKKEIINIFLRKVLRRA